jgi:hypothetical protein
VIVQPPIPEVLLAADLLDRFIGETIEANRARRGDSGRYEATIEAGLLLFQAIRHAEGVTTLARHDLVLARAARALTRAVFEMCQRVRWLLLPVEPLAREARWVAHMADKENMWERLARIAATTGEPVADYSAVAQEIYNFRTSVEAVLPPGTKKVAQVPNLREMPREDGKERYYISYTLMSQSVHGSHFVSGTYRRHLGTKKEFREPQSATEWGSHFQICFRSLHRAISRIIEVACEPGVEAGSPEAIGALGEALRAIEGAGGATPPAG